MNGLQVIFMVLVGVIGILIGMIVELIVDNHTIENLKEHNHKLKLENEQLRRACKTEVIEINDNRAQPESYFTPF